MNFKDKELRKELKKAGVIDNEEYAFAHRAKFVMESGVTEYWKAEVDGHDGRIKYLETRIKNLETKLSAVMELLNITEEEKKRVLRKGKQEVELGKK